MNPTIVLHGVDSQPLLDHLSSIFPNPELRLKNRLLYQCFAGYLIIKNINHFDLINSDLYKFIYKKFLPVFLLLPSNCWIISSLVKLPAKCFENTRAKNNALYASVGIDLLNHRKKNDSTIFYINLWLSLPPRPLDNDPSP